MILRRVLAVFVSVIIITFTIIGAMLYYLLGTYAIEQKKETLFDAGDGIAKISENFIKQDFELYTDYLNNSISLMGKSMDCEIIVADRNGKVLTRTYNIYPEQEIESIPDVLSSVVFEGKHAEIVGDVVGISRKALAIGVPLSYNDVVVSGIYVISEFPAFLYIRKDILLMYITSFIISLVITFVLAYFFSLRIIAPIKKIKQAADAFSRGQMDTRIDISEKNELHILAESFNQMADSLDEIEKKRANFVSDISHELRTPMTTISGFVQGILDETIPYEKQHLYLKIVLDETKRLSKLVNDLLESSRYSSESLKLEKKPFDINEQIRIAIIGFEKRFNEKNIILSATFLNDSEIVYADKDCIKRVITNLIDNAIKFSYRGGKIEIETTSDNNKVKVRIKNEGEGVPDDVKNFVFERFYKFDKSRSKNKNGVGLGLSMVKSILNKHGEKIELNSVAGEYAEFIFFLEKYNN